MEPIIGILELNSKVRHGFTKRGVPLYMFYPYNETIPPMLVSYKEAGRVNLIVLVVAESESRGGLRQVLGTAGQESLEIEAITWQYAPRRWKLGNLILQSQSLFKDRLSLCDKPTINIDPAGCRDIDDLVSIWKEDRSDVWKLAVSISDMGAWVMEHPILQFAEKMGQTLYQEGAAVVPMFPLRFSEGLFSLEPGEERIAITLLATWTGSVLRDLEWKKTIVKCSASYTYENCYSAKEIDMTVLRQIAEHILGINTEDSHKWIEALMIWYNTEAAQVLLQQKEGILRTHSEPELEKIQAWERIGLPAKELAYPAAVYTAIESGRVEYPHWGLSRNAYCHASSPIRRYADVLNQIVLGRAIQGYGPVYEKPYNEMATNLGLLEKQAKRYERDLLFIRAFYRNKDHTVRGIFVENTKVYVPEWKRMISCESIEDVKPGSEVSVKFYAFLGRRSWKKKMVFKIDSLLQTQV